MNRFPKLSFPLVAAILLLGIGLYYFIFERHQNDYWMYLLPGSLLNFYFALKK